MYHQGQQIIINYIRVSSKLGNYLCYCYVAFSLIYGYKLVTTLCVPLVTLKLKWKGEANLLEVQYMKSKEPPKCTGLYLLDKWIEYLSDHWNPLLCHETIIVSWKYIFVSFYKDFVDPKYETWDLRWFLVLWKFHISARKPLMFKILVSTPHN